MLILKTSFSQNQIKAALRKMAFRNGRLKCPHCGYFKVRSIEKRYYCLRCRKKFSLSSNTWLKNIKLPLKTFIALLECWLTGRSVKDAAESLEISRPTIYRYYQLFRLNVAKTVDFKPENDVQVDEAYFGQFKRQANWYHGFMKYKVIDKTGVAGISCPSTGQLRTIIIEGRPGKFINDFIQRNVPTNIPIYSDASFIYRYLYRKGYRHLSMSHDRGFDYSYYIESCWSWMKRRLFKQYHHFTRKYAKDYVQELTWHFNTRKDIKNPLKTLSELT
jgi:transposase-like protein